jgi:hypothetical protein
MIRAGLSHDHAILCLPKASDNCFQASGAEGFDLAIRVLHSLARAGGFKHFRKILRLWIERYACDDLDEIESFLKGADVFGTKGNTFRVPLRI